MDAIQYCCSVLLALVYLAQNQLINGQQTADASSASLCGTRELCVTEQHCNETDDSGRGAIGARIARTCGPNLVCCDREQLESWNATQKTTKTAIPTDVSFESKNSKNDDDDEPSGYESCGEHKECVPRNLCRDNVIVEDGRFIINARIGEIPCKLSLHRCCAIDQRVEAEDSSYVTKLGEFKYQGCGYSNVKGLIPDADLMVNEDVSLFGQFPWMMALLSGRNQYLCGGTLIHRQLVLTSAHNIRNQTVDTLIARAGEYDLNGYNEPYEFQIRRIKQIISHEEFDPLSFYNDISLLVLEEPIEIMPHIQPLCLPPVETPEVQQDLRDALCYATGWGARRFDSDKPNEQLLKRIDLPVISKNECQAQLRLTSLGRRFRLRPSFICAGGMKDKDTCRGDGGSPLFCTMPGQASRFQMAGIVSWGVNCSEEDVPAVYANVPYLRPWIDEKVKQLGFDLTSV